MGLRVSGVSPSCPAVPGAEEGTRAWGPGGAGSRSVTSRREDAVPQPGGPPPRPRASSLVAAAPGLPWGHTSPGGVCGTFGFVCYMFETWGASVPAPRPVGPGPSAVAGPPRPTAAPGGGARAPGAPPGLSQLPVSTFCFCHWEMSPCVTLLNRPCAVSAHRCGKCCPSQEGPSQTSEVSLLGALLASCCRVLLAEASPARGVFPEPPLGRMWGSREAGRAAPSLCCSAYETRGCAGPLAPGMTGQSQRCPRRLCHGRVWLPGHMSPGLQGSQSHAQRSCWAWP